MSGGAKGLEKIYTLVRYLGKKYYFGGQLNPNTFILIMAFFNNFSHCGR